MQLTIDADDLQLDRTDVYALLGAAKASEEFQALPRDGVIAWYGLLREAEGHFRDLEQLSGGDLLGMARTSPGVMPLGGGGVGDPDQERNLSAWIDRLVSIALTHEGQDIKGIFLILQGALVGYNFGHSGEVGPALVAATIVSVWAAGAARRGTARGPTLPDEVGRPTTRQPAALAGAEALANLLRSLFGPEELRRFLKGGPCGDEVEEALPGLNASAAHVADQAVVALVRRGLVTAEFFMRLVEVRPRREADIVTVRAICIPAPEPALSVSSCGPKVFISYAHDSDAHRQRVRALSDQLRREGVDCEIDQYVSGSPTEGWPLWMERRIEWADFVLVVGSERYMARYELREPAGVGRGATWETASVRVDMYEDQGLNAKFLPVLFGGSPEKLLPKPLRAHTWYGLMGAYDALYRVITGQPEVLAPALGTRRVLPPAAP